MFLYWIMNGFRHVSNFFPYNDVVTKVNQQGFYKFIYFVMNFTEGNFTVDFYNAFLTNRRSDCFGNFIGKIQNGRDLQLLVVLVLGLGYLLLSYFPLFNYLCFDFTRFLQKKCCGYQRLLWWSARRQL